MPVDEGPPVPFGPNLRWLCMPVATTEEAVVALHEADPQMSGRTARLCSWTHGVAAAHRRKRPYGIFVTPPVHGWVFALDYPYYGDEFSFRTRFARLSEGLDRPVYMFGTFENVPSVSWGMAKRGELRRAYLAIAGTTYLDVGPPLSAEGRNIDKSSPLRLAAALTVDPSALGRRPYDAPGVGLLL